MVRDLSVTELEARPLEDPEVAALLANAGLPVPARPALLIADGDSLEMLSGWAMRRRLAGVIGWRRAGAIASLLAAEGRARLARSAQEHGLSRRGIIGGALAAAAGWILMPGAASASTRPGTSRPESAAPDEVRAALATASGQRAVRTWGEVDAKAYKLTRNGRVTVMLSHPRDGILTSIIMSPAASGGRHPAVSLGATPGAEHALRYYTTGGTPLADVRSVGGRVEARPVPKDAVTPGRTARVEEPDATAKQIACFVACTGRRYGANCLGDCINCAAYIYIHKHPEGLSCTECFACATSHGAECVDECGIT